MDLSELLVEGAGVAGFDVSVFAVESDVFDSEEPSDLPDSELDFSFEPDSFSFEPDSLSWDFPPFLA